MIALVFMSGAIFLEENKMQNNVAKFIRGTAFTIITVGILASLIVGFNFINDKLTAGLGWGILVGGIISAVIVFSILLGISELVEKSEEQSLYLYKLYSSYKTQSKSNPESNGNATIKADQAKITGKTSESAPTHSWRCDSCGNMISSSPCPYCKK